MTTRAVDVWKLLDQAASGGAVEIPASFLADPDTAELVFTAGTLRIDGAVCDPQALSVGGHATTTASSSPVPVRVSFTADGDWVTGALAVADLGENDALVLVDGAPADAALPAGAWALTDGRALRLARRAPAPPTDPGRLDGLGRALPAIRQRDWVRDHTPQALVTENGILTPRPGPRRRKGMRVLDSPAVRGWSPIGTPSGENGLSVNYYNPPLHIAGALTALPAAPPYKAVLGGVLVVDTGAFNGSAMGAYVVPDGSGADPSLFAYGSLGSATGFGPPMFQVRGISAGFGWNSRVTVPSADGLSDFPFLIALDNPGEIGADEDEVDPLNVLSELLGTWVNPQQGDLWFAAGLAFDCFETFRGHAMALVQTGSDLTISLLGVGGAQLPTKSDKKIARVEIGIEATLRPVAGELSIGAAFTEKTFLIDPNCKLRGGVGMKFWFGRHPHAGDFALLLGAIPAGRELPTRYPKQQPAGLTWGVGSTVNISGNAYAAFTPKSLMAGGSLEVVFQSGMLRAWLDARIDALVEWNPFYFDIGMGVRVGVSATIKIWFVKIRISIEVGVSVRVWGPAVGGEATVHLWFISFTIGFGAKRRSQAPALDWGGFQGMLPPPENMVSTTAIAGYEGEGAPATRGAIKPWLVSNGGFTFTADTQGPRQQGLPRPGQHHPGRHRQHAVGHPAHAPTRQGQRTAGLAHPQRKRPLHADAVGPRDPARERPQRPVGPAGRRAERRDHPRPDPRGAADVAAGRPRHLHRVHRRTRHLLRPDQPRRQPAAVQQRTGHGTAADAASARRCHRRHPERHRHRHHPWQPHRPGPGPHRPRREPRRARHQPQRLCERCGHRLHRRADARRQLTGRAEPGRPHCHRAGGPYRRTPTSALPNSSPTAASCRKARP
ncbi:hypothetical protein P3T34_002880 [Kitasatospora sp. MAP12-44]|uniref:DUF6603 domain-containing protein n=1 Tax=Kitasatospora sp. MAP12-44 TaxID=3035099 RepID=UPI002476F8F4|nr:DUF6603 domain-containing protein [Kitasatospora sp. MAP12-44]MDH6110665.1 hypothetical protein [Kitasatospora sp. MAP12-44]